jgi:uncharacterized protein Veg
LANVMSPREVAVRRKFNLLIKERVKELKGEDVVIRYGKGKRRRREVRGRIARTLREIFTLEYEKGGHTITEAFRYKDLVMGTFSITLENSGAEVLPRPGGA